MKKLLIIVVFLFIGATVKAQSGSLKYCPGTPAWNANKQMMTNETGMYNEYAKGPDGCWWLKTAKFTSYKKGYYQWDKSGKKYYYSGKKNGVDIWESADRKMCLPKSPFGN